MKNNYTKRIIIRWIRSICCVIFFFCPLSVDQVRDGNVNIRLFKMLKASVNVELDQADLKRSVFCSLNLFLFLVSIFFVSDCYIFCCCLLSMLIFFNFFIKKKGLFFHCYR